MTTRGCGVTPCGFAFVAERASVRQSVGASWGERWNLSCDLPSGSGERCNREHPCLNQRAVRYEQTFHLEVISDFFREQISGYIYM